MYLDQKCISTEEYVKRVLLNLAVKTVDFTDIHPHEVFQRSRNIFGITWNRPKLNLTYLCESDSPG
jgi:hypothetical protein